jgi:hypothetical protein
MSIQSFGLYTLAVQEFTRDGLEPPFGAWLNYAQQWIIAYGRGWTKVEAIRAALDDALAHSAAYRRDGAAAMEDAYKRIANSPDE